MKGDQLNPGAFIPGDPVTMDSVRVTNNSFWVSERVPVFGDEGPRSTRTISLSHPLSYFEETPGVCVSWNLNGTRVPVLR